MPYIHLIVNHFIKIYNYNYVFVHDIMLRLWMCLTYGNRLKVHLVEVVVVIILQ
jgi:hypothetical protein